MNNSGCPAINVWLEETPQICNFVSIVLLPEKTIESIKHIEIERTDRTLFVTSTFRKGTISSQRIIDIIRSA